MTGWGSAHCLVCGVTVPLTMAGALSWHADWRNVDQTCAGSLAWTYVRLDDAPTIT